MNVKSRTLESSKISSEKKENNTSCAASTTTALRGVAFAGFCPLVSQCKCVTVSGLDTTFHASLFLLCGLQVLLAPTCDTQRRQRGTILTDQGQTINSK